MENYQIDNLATVSISHDATLSLWKLVEGMNVFQTFLSLGLLQTDPYSYTKLGKKETGEVLRCTLVNDPPIIHCFF